MFKKILIANRGEIAQRVIRTCREMGVETVAVYSKGDEGAGYLELADETICIGPAQSAQSYLDPTKIISAAEITDVQAIHPGYGFLSENADFADLINECGISWIGPPADAIAKMGDKATARAMARQIGVPVLPGSEGLIETDESAREIAHEIGYPVIIKATAGGGGRGMRVASNDISLMNGLMAARAEAEASFSNSAVYLEKFIEKPRHVEVQILADTHGNLIHLGERDCTVQRRHQKVVEEAPCPVIDEAIRQRMGEDAKKLARACGYTNAGTVEFIMDEDGSYYFMEMNTRLQVEHPVTEMVTGMDLVREQLLVAHGDVMTITKQEDVKMTGASIEVRINAEDPSDNFKPSPGLITGWYAPGGRGIRIDSQAHAGYKVPPHYDSMIGKLIVYRESRDEAILTMRRALREFKVEGIKTSIPLLRKILNHTRFRRSQIDTGFIEKHIQLLD